MPAPETIREASLEEQLARLGLTAEVITRAVKSGYIARTSCTANHPVVYPGMVQYGETNRHLRDGLKPLGWSCLNDRNMELTISPEGGIAVVVAGGNEGVGQVDKKLTTRRRKGATTTQAVDTNRQLPFDFLVPDIAPIVTDDGTKVRQTWVLLHFFTRTELRYELALPVTIGDDGYIETWKERIIFPPVSIDGTDIPIMPEYAEQPDVDVQERSQGGNV